MFLTWQFIKHFLQIDFIFLMQDQTSTFWLFIFGFFQRENDKLVKGNEVFYFIESHYNDFGHISFDSTKLYIFKLVYWKELKNGTLYTVVAIQNFLNSWGFSLWKLSNLTTIKI